MTKAATAPSTWSMALQTLRRPYPVSIPFVLLLLLVPFYIFIGESMPGRTLHAPALPLDDVLPLQPASALVYGTLYAFVILLPLFVVRQEEHIRRTVLAYLLVWLSAYACFLLYPTVAPRPAKVVGQGFVAWGLRFLYAADPPYNCFPSLHVAHSFVSAWTCNRVHRGVGAAAAVSATLIAISTLFTKQHYVLDVLAGVLLSSIAYAVFLRGFPRRNVPELDRRVAPALAFGVAAIIGAAVMVVWVAYRVSAG